MCHESGVSQSYWDHTKGRPVSPDRYIEQSIYISNSNLYTTTSQRYDI